MKPLHQYCRYTCPLPCLAAGKHLSWRNLRHQQHGKLHQQGTSLRHVSPGFSNALICAIRGVWCRQQSCFQLAFSSMSVGIRPWSPTKGVMHTCAAVLGLQQWRFAPWFTENACLRWCLKWLSGMAPWRCAGGHTPAPRRFERGQNRPY